MLDKTLKTAADRFAETILNTDVVKSFLAYREAYERDPDINRLRKELSEAVKAFRERQRTGEVNDSDIKRVRALQAALNKHPVVEGCSHAYDLFVDVLRESNAAISELLGMDFAETAAPAHSCCS